ncbi:hypothetical protein [Actinokineospora pegani]|uniref:hypothetical protein n=1 Tax=Actinokineospora pegani TaxID=2654637 RepID=UPI0012EB010B|nr:hypothetical protein [Actinokineospora pegani]
MTGTESTRVDDRRTLHLTFSREEQQVQAPGGPAPGGPPPGPAVQHRTPRERVLVLAEHLLGGWAPRLRSALLMLGGLLVSLVLIAVFAGPLPALVGVGALAAVISSNRRT